MVRTKQIENKPIRQGVSASPSEFMTAAHRVHASLEDLEEPIPDFIRYTMVYASGKHQDGWAGRCRKFTRNKVTT